MYEDLIARMLLATELGAWSLLVKSDSLLVIGQITGEYQAKNLQLASYLRYVQILRSAFSTFDLVHVPREQNSRAYLLFKLANLGKGGRQRSVIQETFVEYGSFDDPNLCWRVDALLLWLGLSSRVFRILVKIILSHMHKLDQPVLKEKNVFQSKKKNNWLKSRYNRLFCT